MISIRETIFETNSSSCHKLIVPYGQEFSVPKTLNLDNSEAQGIYYLLDILDEYENKCEDWVKFLYASGVEEIKYTGTNHALRDAIEKYKGTTEYNYRPVIGDIKSSSGCPDVVLLSALFGENTKYLWDAFDDERVPEEKDGKHFCFIWR